MVREIRIKDSIIGPFVVNGSNVGPFYSTESINGQLLRVTVLGITSPGSLIIGESGTNLEFWRKNSFVITTSGIDVYPGVFQVDATNTVIGSPNFAVDRVTKNPIYVTGSGFTSGTGIKFGPVIVNYS